MDLTLLLIFIGLIILSGMFSGAETAFIMSHKAKALVWRRKKVKFSNLLFSYVINPEKYLVSTLVGNNAVNVLYTTVGTLLLIPFYPEELVTVILAFIILLFSEITPKVYFSIMADKFVRYFSVLIKVTAVLLWPVTFIAEKLTNLSLKSVSMNQKEVESLFSKEDIHHIFSEVFDKSDENYKLLPYLRKTLVLKNTKVKEVMIPTVDMIFLHDQMSIEEIIKIFNDGNFTRLPIIDDSIDKIIGYIHVKELIKRPEKIEDLIHDILFIPDTKSCYEALRDLRKEQKSFAVLIDEFGSTSGVVFLENIISIIVGDIELEYEDVKTYNTIIKLSETVFKVSGRAQKEHLEQLGLSIQDGPFETMAGFILEEIRRIPEKGESFEFDNFKIKILSVAPNRIQWVLLELQNETTSI